MWEKSSSQLQEYSVKNFKDYWDVNNYYIKISHKLVRKILIPTEKRFPQNEQSTEQTRINKQTRIMFNLITN